MKKKIETIVIQRETCNRILRLLLLDQFRKGRLFPLQKNYDMPAQGEIFDEFEIPNVKIIVRDFNKKSAE